MRVKTVRQRIEKKACFRDQLLKNSSQTAVYLSYDFCSRFYDTCLFGLKLYTVKHNGPDIKQPPSKNANKKYFFQVKV